ncbi:MAG TPA: Ig-like domain-containing protein, partial [Vicinamibacterales bacterium]
MASADAQPAGRRATNIAAILAYPSFYHLRPILLVGTVAQQQNGEFRVSDGTGSLRVIPDGNVPDGRDEVRGQFWDLGRMKPDDPRLAGYDLRAAFHVDPEGAWPRPGEMTVIIASAIAPAAPPTGLASAPGSTKSPGFAPASIRSIVLDASRYVDQKLTITGQFYGRNLTGDLPDAPRQSRYDFVLRAADAAIWVTNVRPKGKDAKGRNFELGLDARIDTGKWLQISGTLKQGRGLLWIDGEAGSLALAQAPTDIVAPEEAPVRVPVALPAEVVFSAPTEDETDVSLATNVRIQFSRDLDPATFRG